MMDPVTDFESGGTIPLYDVSSPDQTPAKLSRSQPHLRCGAECAHEWHPVTEVGDWIHNQTGTLTVKQIAATPNIWDDGSCELGHDELRRRIASAGGVDCDHALEAITLQTGVIHLLNGVHRWVVAVELGISTVLVRMADDRGEPSWAWP